MKFNGKEYAEMRGDDKIYRIPILKAGDRISVPENEDTSLPGTKPFKKGIYKVLKVREGFSARKSLVYELQLDRKNSKYVHPIYTIGIDKAIEDNVIIVLE